MAQDIPEDIVPWLVGDAEVSRLAVVKELGAGVHGSAKLVVFRGSNAVLKISHR